MGLTLSGAMVARLRAKPGGEDIARGDRAFADDPGVPGVFTLLPE